MLRLRLIEELEAPHRQQMSAVETVLWLFSTSYKL
jgi:hypothetical protein